MCDCIERAVEALKGTNRQLSIGINLTTGKALPLIATEPIAKGIQTKKFTLLPTYCPFCGLKYDA